MFWTYWTELPDGSGYEQFSGPHLLMLGILLFLYVLILKRYEQQDEEKKNRILSVTSCVPLVMECIRDIMLACNGAFALKQLPFHLCGQAILVEFMHGRMQEGKKKDVLSELIFVLFMPGAMAALLFPDWTVYPLWNYWSLNSCFTHFFLVLYALMLYKDQKVHADVKHSWHALVYLLLSAAVIAPLNVLWHANFMFLMEAPAPLDVIQARHGQIVYIIVLALTGYGMSLLVYLVNSLLQKKH